MNLENYLIAGDVTIRKAMEKLNIGNKILFVVESEKKLIGTITDGDIRRWILASNSIDEPVTKAMNMVPKTVGQNEKSKARLYIKELKLTAIPVVDDCNHIVDIVCWDSEGVERARKEIKAPVVLMAGGKGERLMPYTSIVPKPLIPIGEKPISELVVESFRKFGCDKFYFTLNYKKNMIKAYYDELERDYSVEYIEEDEPLGTGGSLFYVKDCVKGTFFVSNCDILLDVDYADVLSFHRKHGNIITVVTSLKKYTIPYGTVRLDANGRIEQLVEKPSTDYLVNTGVYVLEPEAFDYLKEKKKIHLTEIVELCLKDGKNVGTYPIGEDAWMDMGQFEELEKMRKRFF
ncbi:MAG: nucleotidyltransferase family protein [Clostridia bacterium]|nr:nucleotidyltransferase family protein [Clostridia bacterium]